ncbi:MAG TPA: hypothetical protein VFN35_15585 [Ktedonobacteraceae bacterium]|nr:hypothetical protein [Ktedonobacteraceae bacterium]
MQKAVNLGTIEAAANSSCWGYTVPKRKRAQREHTEDWQTIQQFTLWTLGPDEWLLFKKLPDYAARTK